jgi:hypothetical protein
MPLTPICENCGRPVKYVVVEDGERIALDPIPTIDGTYRLDPNDAERAELIDRPGHQGFNDHAMTCPGH